MKLIHFALALTFVLIGLTAYVAWQAHIEARGAHREIQLFRQQQNAQIAQGAVPMPGVLADPSSLAPASPAPIPSPSIMGTLEPVTPPSSLPPRDLPNPAAQPIEPTPPTLTAEQRQVLSLPAIARVKAAVSDQGFVVIDAGTDQNLTPSMQFNLRRSSAIVGTVRITDTIEASEAIADILPGSVPAGVTLQEGDQLIQIVGP